MQHNPKDYEGTFTAIITPFKNETKEIDWDSFKALIENQISNNIDGIVVAGTTGESPTLNWVENDEIIEKAVLYAKGRIKVIAGTGSNCTREAVEHSILAEKKWSRFSSCRHSVLQQANSKWNL